MANGILVPLDGSPLAARALPYAELLAERCQAELLLATAVQPQSRRVEIWEEARERACAEAQERLDAIQLAATGRGLSVSSAVEVGDPATTLLTLARAHDIALIVMATHGRSGPSRWVMGSVAEQLLRKTHLPILLLTPATLDAGGPERLRQRLIVPDDGSELSARIHPVVKEIGRRLHLPLTLVSATDPASFYSGGAGPYIAMSNNPLELAQEAEAASFARLQDVAHQWQAEGLSTEAVAVQGRPIDIIIQAANEKEAGWVAMASHGRSGLGGLVLGSTALAVLRQVAVPVLLAAMPRPDRYHLGNDDATGKVGA